MAVRGKKIERIVNDVLRGGIIRIEHTHDSRFTSGRIITLNDRKSVSEDRFRLLLDSGEIVPLGDALFGESQTYGARHGEV